MSRKLYPSDLTAAQWEELAPLLPPDTKRGPPRTTDLREVVNGILYVLRGGIPWRLMPHDLPPWGTVWWYFRNWRDDGTWERVESTLRARVREAAGRDATPSAAIIDSQSVKTTEKGGRVITTSGKRVTGRKRHIVVDTMGLLLAVVVHAANIQKVGARQTLGPVSPSTGNLGGCWLRGPTGVVGLGQRPMVPDRGQAQTGHPPLRGPAQTMGRGTYPGLVEPMPTVEQRL